VISPQKAKDALVDQKIQTLHGTGETPVTPGAIAMDSSSEYINVYSDFYYIYFFSS
jgi:hypothetical protein